MKGQVRGLALELLRQDCVESLDQADKLYTKGASSKTYNEAERNAIAACKLYDNALHGSKKNDN
jgi:hypothetical protein|tara:strand:- start:1715 stop:1906 length:192 start_codon:yes stop_codon:yes gene_type:complete